MRPLAQILAESLKIQVEQNDLLRQITSVTATVERLLTELRRAGASPAPGHILENEERKLHQLDDQRQDNQRRLEELRKEMQEFVPTGGGTPDSAP